MTLSNNEYNAMLYNNLLKDLYKEFPKLKIKKRKEVWWCRLLDKTFLKHSKSQWGCASYNLIVVPNRFDEWLASEKYEMIMHEREHLYQYVRLGDDNALLGYVLFCFLYVLVLPAVLTMRAHFERQAYYCSALSIHLTKTFVDYAWAKQWFISWMVHTFCRWEYVWMWPFKKYIKRWANRAWVQAQFDATAAKETWRTKRAGRY